MGTLCEALVSHFFPVLIRSYSLDLLEGPEEIPDVIVARQQSDLIHFFVGFGKQLFGLFYAGLIQIINKSLSCFFLKGMA